jgi:hypothetical protein
MNIGEPLFHKNTKRQTTRSDRQSRSFIAKHNRDYCVCGGGGGNKKLEICGKRTRQETGQVEMAHWTGILRE